MMEHKGFYKAQPFKDQAVTDVSLVFMDTIPDAPTIEMANIIYNEEARTLAETLWNTLPGGVFDRLVIELMSKKVSSFKIAHGG